MVDGFVFTSAAQPIAPDASFTSFSRFAASAGVVLKLISSIIWYFFWYWFYFFIPRNSCKFNSYLSIGENFPLLLRVFPIKNVNPGWALRISIFHVWRIFPNPRFYSTLTACLLTARRSIPASGVKSTDAIRQASRISLR